MSKEMIELKVENMQDFYAVVEKARDIADDNFRDVYFNFNGVKCIVNASSTVDSMFTDYNWSFIMGWKEVNGFKHLDPDNIIKYGRLQKKLDAIDKWKSEAESKINATYWKKRQKILTHPTV